MQYFNNIAYEDETYQVEDPEAVKTEGGELEETIVNFDDRETDVTSWDDFLTNHFDSGLEVGQWFKDFKESAKFLSNTGSKVYATYIPDTKTISFSIDSPVELKPLADCTPDEIAKIVQSGQAQDVWSIGDSIGIALNGTVGAYTFDNETWYAEIIGFDHNKDLETGGASNVTFQFGVADGGTKVAFIDDNYNSNGSSDGFRMNTSNINSGGWESSYMRNTICPQFLEVMPQEWQNIIKPTIKYTDNVGGGNGNIESNITATEDKIFLLSEYEIFNSQTYSNTYEANYQTPYNDRYTSSSNRIRYRHSATGSTCRWWERSVYQGNSGNFCYVDTNGSSTIYSGAYSSYGFAPAYTIF